MDRFPTNKGEVTDDTSVSLLVIKEEMTGHVRNWEGRQRVKGKVWRQHELALSSADRDSPNWKPVTVKSSQTGFHDMLDTKLEFQINPNVTDQYQSQKPADCLWAHSDPQSRVTVTYYRCYRTLCTQRSDQQHNDANGRETYTPVALITNKKNTMQHT